MKSKGIVLLCNTDNTIKSVLYNDLEIEQEILEGSDLIALFIETDIVKVKRFIKEIIREGAQFNWELNVILKNEVKTLVFDGALFDGVILLVGGIDNMNFELLSHELLKINNDQVNNVRSMAKQIADHSKQQEMLQKKSLDEMSLLNNELSNLQRQVMKQKIELERLNELKNQFLGIAAHDLRNPLGNIINLTEFLQDDIQDFSQDQAEFIGHIRDLSSYMLNLVNELLDYSAIEAGNITLNLEPTDFIELINKTLQYNKGFADKKDITITFTNKHKSIIIPIDVIKIEQVINNLLTNAIKYSHKGSNVFIEIEENKESIILSVKDEGLGIAKDERELLFKPFQKTGTKSTGGEKSMGLGLYIVKRIIDAHNGSIRVESAVNKGSTFYVELPKNPTGREQ